MGYSLQAFLGTKNDMQQFGAKFTSSKLVSLTDELIMIPLTPKLYFEINGVEEPESLYPGDGNIDALEPFLLIAMANSKLAYFEADYFGGHGGQEGIVWENGARIKTLEYGQNCINQLLSEFGVKASGKLDEFDTVNLGRHRNTEDW